MKEPRVPRWRKVPFLRLATPRGFLKSAVLILVLFAGTHLAGLRDYTCFFSGTLAGGEQGYLSILLGCLYAASYFAAVIAAPVLALSAALQALFLRLHGRFSRKSSEAAA